MKNHLIIIKPGFLVLFLLLILVRCNVPDPSKQKPQLWLTQPDRSELFSKHVIDWAEDEKANDSPVISVNENKTYQTMDGFGFTLTGGSARLIHTMSEAKQNKLLKELFSTEGDNIGISYLRLSIGASDLSDSVFFYNDLPPGETDAQMKKFSIDMERVHLIPVLKKILKINPDISIMGSPWSAPPWMKDNKSAIGGSLKREYFDAYALYFVKYIQAMKEAGIPIDAITVQNEPLHPGNNPSMYMTAEDQKKFVRDHLGPAFEKENINTGIVIYDHNADRPDYPLTILDDPEARKYVDGSAFHLYGGEIEALSQVHQAYPDKNLYFTEQWIGAPGDFPENLRWHTENLIIGASRNWCKTVLEWNLAADENQDPHTDSGGCTRCLGAVTINGDKVTRNPAYYIVAHASKFVRPGSVRIASNMPEHLPNVAFKTPDNKIVVIVLNNSDEPSNFEISLNDKTIKSKLKGGAVGTYVVKI